MAGGARNTETADAVTVELSPAQLAGSAFSGPERIGGLGGGPRITIETASLLRYRLRAAAGFLLLAFLLFFAYRLIRGDLYGPADDLTFYFHFAVVVALGASCALLCRKCVIPQRVLRLHELVIFGLPAAYLLVYDYELFTTTAPKGFLASPLAAWIGIVFTYSMFIPNNWRRAAVVHAALCVAPLLALAYAYRTNAEVAAALEAYPPLAIEMVIMLGVTFLAATYGTQMINSLRTEAYEARQLGQYRLCKRIGAGGMGEVYLAEHQLMKRPCAIKLIRPGKAADPQALARFEREVQATARLSHWNTIEIFDYGRTEDGTFYYVMEFLPGMSLAELVDRHGPLPASRALHLLVQTCDALAEAHAEGLIHRDLKPGNIFAARRGGVYDVAKLLDFGLAKPIDSTPVDMQLTQEGAITGSPLFMSPEQALGDREPDARSDIYSLGAVAYFLATGGAPFESDRPIKVILSHAHDEVVPPSRRGQVPPDVERVILRCLAKDPAKRYQDAVSLRRAWQECGDFGSWTAEDATQWWRSREPDRHAGELVATA